MHLALHRARADRAPRNQVGVILPKGGVQKLGRHRQAEPGDVDHQFAGEPQPRVDLKALVEKRVVDQALPAQHRPRFFEIYAHDEQQFARVSWRRIA